MKPKESKLVVVRRSRSGIENIGFDMELRRTYKVWGYLLIVTLICVATTSFIYKPAAIVFGVAGAALYVTWGWHCYKAGRRLWKDVKDKEEPVQL